MSRLSQQLTITALALIGRILSERSGWLGPCAEYPGNITTASSSTRLPPAKPGGTSSFHILTIDFLCLRHTALSGESADLGQGGKMIGHGTDRRVPCLCLPESPKVSRARLRVPDTQLTTACTANTATSSVYLPLNAADSVALPWTSCR